MAKIFGINIPAGWEDLFNLIFRQQSPALLNVLNTAAPIKRRSSYSALVLRSYFVMWQSLYDSFDSARRHSWDLYWLTLPFGSHSGANGWPGSGYSAFIYCNAPRYKAGLSLFFDPPYGVECLQNIDFSQGANFWELVRNCFIQSGHLVFVNPPPYYSGGLIRQTTTINPSNGDSGTLRVEIDAEGVGQLYVQIPADPSIRLVKNFTGERETIIMTASAPGWYGNYPFALLGLGYPTGNRFAGNIYKFSVQFKK